jgi:hypothetical protein
MSLPLCGMAFSRRGIPVNTRTVSNMKRIIHSIIVGYACDGEDEFGAHIRPVDPITECILYLNRPQCPAFIP